MKQQLILVFALALVSGCAAVDFVPIHNSPRALAARPADEVEVFTTKRPEQPYTEVGIISAEAFRGGYGGSSWVRLPELIEMVRAKAAEVGCDGVILQPSGDMSYQGTCIVYDKSQPKPAAAEKKPADAAMVTNASPDAKATEAASGPCPGQPDPRACSNTK